MLQFKLIAVVLLLGGLAGVRSHLLAQAAPTIPGNAGVNIHFLDSPDGMAALQSLGAGWLRMDFAWGVIESEPGVYDFSATDCLMREARERKIAVLAILDYSNPLYEAEQKVTTAAGREAFAAYGTALAKRYADQTVVWEIWNEPNNGGFWPGNDPVEYMNLVKTVSERMRRSVPGVRLAGPSTYQMDTAYIEACLQNGLLDAVDAISFHPYRRERPEDLVEDMAQLHQLLRRYVPAGAELPPVIGSEWGFSTLFHGEQGQAERVARSLFLSMLTGMEFNIYYDLWNDGTSLTNSEHHYGLFTAPPYLVPKRAARSYMAALRVMDGCSFAERLNLTAEQDHFVLAMTDRDGQPRYVHWAVAPEGEGVTWIVPPEMGAVTRVDLWGQAIAGRMLPGDRLVSTSAVEYLLPAPPVEADWRVLAQLLPAESPTEAPWRADLPLRGPQQAAAPELSAAAQADTGLRDWQNGTVDFWFQPTVDDYGKLLVEGGDLEQSLVTLRIGLDDAGCVYAAHWCWQGQNWTTGVHDNQPVVPGRWVRITYQWGDDGERLFLNGMPVAAFQAENRPLAFSFRLRRNPTVGAQGLFTLIDGKGFQP